MPDNKCEHCSFEVNALKELMIEKFTALKEIVDRIDEQTQRTNGRTSSLERWRAYITGAVGVIGFFIAYVWFYIKK